MSTLLETLLNERKLVKNIYPCLRNIFWSERNKTPWFSNKREFRR